jgi:hypothetical protein
MVGPLGGGLFPPVEPDPPPQDVSNKVMDETARKTAKRMARDTRFTNHPNRGGAYISYDSGTLDGVVPQFLPKVNQL